MKLRYFISVILAGYFVVVVLQRKRLKWPTFVGYMAPECLDLLPFSVHFYSFFFKSMLNKIRIYYRLEINIGKFAVVKFLKKFTQE